MASSVLWFSFEWAERWKWTWCCQSAHDHSRQTATRRAVPYCTSVYCMLVNYWSQAGRVMSQKCTEFPRKKKNLLQSILLVLSHCFRERGFSHYSMKSCWKSSQKYKMNCEGWSSLPQAHHSLWLLVSLTPKRPLFRTWQLVSWPWIFVVDTSYFAHSSSCRDRALTAIHEKE